jgi:hypothetical protein
MQLDSEKIVETVQLLSRRIHERFPEAGLNNVAHELLAIARHAKVRAKQISRPIRWVRLVSVLVTSLILVAFVATLVLIVGELPEEAADLAAADLIQVIDAAFSALLLVGATILSLMTWETRVKRSRALSALHELRVIAHIIDMHELTKDPERTLGHGNDTASSPQRTMTVFQLGRYLDYCSEMLALTGKVAALYVQGFEDAEVVAAVNDIEDLTSGLSRKIWQKIMILHELPDATTPPTPT